jgi:hypothetical protein
MIMTTSLLRALADILERAGETVLLRETELGPDCIDRGDIDLLVAAHALPTILDIIDDVAAERDIHYWLQRSGPHKTGVALFSADMSHSIRIDLWVQLWQVFGGRSYLTYEDVARFAVDTDGPLQRLPADLEAAVYVQHLAIMDRDPTISANAERLAGLVRRCSSHVELAEALERILTTGRIDKHLRDQCGEAIEARGRVTRRRSVLGRARRRWLEIRTLDAVALVGVDGCGKTSLGDAVAEALDYDRLPAMNAYRRSLLFRGIYKANRLTLKRPYETIDKILAPVTYAVAACRIPKLVSAHTVLDRYLGDFLIVDRKSDEPRLSRFAVVLGNFYRPCKTIHIRASWATIANRKNEVTEKGHAWYDVATLRYYRSQPVVDYLAFRNDGSIGPAAAALTEYLVNQQQHRR